MHKEMPNKMHTFGSDRLLLRSCSVIIQISFYCIAYSFRVGCRMEQNLFTNCEHIIFPFISLNRCMYVSVCCGYFFSFFSRCRNSYVHKLQFKYDFYAFLFTLIGAVFVISSPCIHLSTKNIIVPRAFVCDRALLIPITQCNK